MAGKMGLEPIPSAQAAALTIAPPPRGPFSLPGGPNHAQIRVGFAGSKAIPFTI